MRELFNEQMFYGMNSVSPILSEIAHHQQREGKESSYQDEQGKLRKINYQKRSVAFEHKFLEARGMSFEDFVKVAREPGIEMGKLMLKDLFQRMEEVTKETGNVINADGNPLTYEFLLSAWDKIQIDFDERGRPKLPSLVLDPRTHAELQQKLPHWIAEPEFQRRCKDLFLVKRREFCEREACRRLVE